MNAEDTVMSINAWLDSLGIDRAYKKDMRVTYWYLKPRLEAQARITWDIAIQEGRRDVVEFVEEIGFICSKTRWQAKLTEWGIA